MKNFLFIFTVVWMSSTLVAIASELSATAYLEKMESQIQGHSTEAMIKMKVERPSDSREIEFKSWSVEKQKSLIKILKPQKDRDTGNLRIKYELWQYLPKVEQVVKIPASLMLQNWMGSDFTNDDLVKASSLSRDYNSKILAREKQAGVALVKIECRPKPNAPIAWTKVLVWLRLADSVPVREEYYNDEKTASKIMVGSMVKTFGNHTIPTQMVMFDPQKSDSKTTLTYENIIFDKPIPDSVFTQLFLKRPTEK